MPLLPTALPPFFLSIYFLSSAPALAQTTQSAPSLLAADHFTADIQKALGINATSANLLPALENAIKNAKNSDLDAQRDSLITLIDTLLAGPDPAAVLEQVVPHCQIGTDATPPTKSAADLTAFYGNLYSLILRMQTLAASTADADPQHAATFAAASKISRRSPSAQ